MEQVEIRIFNDWDKRLKEYMQYNAEDLGRNQLLRNIIFEMYRHVEESTEQYEEIMQLRDEVRRLRDTKNYRNEVDEAIEQRLKSVREITIGDLLDETY